MTTPNETPEQRRERMNDILKRHVNNTFCPSITQTINAMIAVEDACRATMFTEEQVREAILLAHENVLGSDQIIEQIKQ